MQTVYINYNQYNHMVLNVGNFFVVLEAYTQIRTTTTTIIIIIIIIMTITLNSAYLCPWESKSTLRGTIIVSQFRELGDTSRH